MTTADTDALTERIAHATFEDRYPGYSWESAPEYVKEAHRAKYTAVLPIVAEEVRKAKAEALREAARYFAGGLHCADMRATPEETVRDLNRRAAEHEAGDQR